MARFNKKTKTSNKTTNLAGGQAYKQSAKGELISILLTSMLNDQYYRTAQDGVKRLDGVLSQVDPEFAAKSAIYARTKFGMRTITHVLAGKLASRLSGSPIAKNFYDKVIFRPDDMSEILAYYKQIGNDKLSGAMKKGFAKAFNKFDTYQIGKYQMKERDYSLVDIVNMVRPKATERNQEGLRKLINGESFEAKTWEAKMTQAGQKGETKEEKDALKAEAWAELLNTGKIGYFALLRNLRNIYEQTPNLVDKACELLTNEKMIKSPKNLVMPFRYVTAYEIFKDMNDKNGRKIRTALDRAIRISCDNVPRFDGDTLVVIDYSGSMGEGYDSYKGKATILASILAETNDADVMIFGNDSTYIPYNPGDNIFSTVDRWLGYNSGGYFGGGNSPYQVGHGTNFQSIFQRANKDGYDRVLIFSDMQGWGSYYTPQNEFNQYVRETGRRPYVYSVDLAGYGTLQFPEKNVFCLAGYSEKMFDTMKNMEHDPKALIKEIEAIEL